MHQKLAYLAYPDDQPAGDSHKTGWVGNGCTVSISKLAYLAYPDHQPAGDSHKAGWVGNVCIASISNWPTLHIQVTSQQGTATRLGGWEMVA
jgi:hypothetical protein